MMAATTDSGGITFECPSISPKAYITKGPSGWPETFKRAAADKALATFVAPLEVAELVDMFVTTRRLSDNKEPTEWPTIVGFLSRTMGCSPRAVPANAGIAFWGQVVITLLGVGTN